MKLKTTSGVDLDQLPLVYLILAQNEGTVMPRSLQAVNAQLCVGDQLHVVADHCHDRTAELARSYGAIVHERHENGPTGKAAALHWWVLRQNFDPAQPIIILDADSVVLPGFTSHIRIALKSGVAGVQAALMAESEEETRIGRLIALSERMEQSFFDHLRSRLGGSVRLRGTGMVLRFGLLRRYAPILRTKTEDIELTLLLAKNRVKVAPAFEARLIDPKPNIPEGAINQRARWLQGQVEVLHRYPGTILKLFFWNPLGFSLVMSALFKPRSIFSGGRMLACLAAIVGLLLSASPMGLLIPIAGVSLMVNLPDLFGLGYTLWKSPHRKADLNALAALPAFMVLWIRSLVRASLSRSPWLRVRPIRVPAGLNETATASNS